VPYTNAIIDLCQPFKLNIAVIGQKNSGKSTLIQSIVNILVDYQKNKNYFSKTSGYFGGEVADDKGMQSRNTLAEAVKKIEAKEMLNLDEITMKNINIEPIQKSKSDMHGE